MAVTFEETVRLKRELEETYRDRHYAFAKLRDYWHGRYWENIDTQANALTSIFKDLVNNRSDVGPDVKLVHNVVQMVCVKFQTFLSPLPQIRMYVDPPETDMRRAQSTKKERFLYGCWAHNQMNRLLNKKAWYLPLMGDVFLGIHPDFRTNVPAAFLRSPEHAYPIPSYEPGGERGIIFAWKVKESAVRREFPKYKLRSERRTGFARIVTNVRGAKPADPEVEIIEYSDNKCFYRWVDGVEVNGVEHNLGFDMYEHVKFIDVPDEVWGHGAVEQAVNLNEMGNALYSLMFQAVIDNVFPRLVLINPAKAPELIDTGPGAVLPINEGGDAKWLHPPVQALAMQSAFLENTEQAIKQATGMPDVNFGVSPAKNIVTGAAINELQGAGTGSTVEMVQGTGMGPALVSWNAKAITMTQRMFPDEKINLFGVLPGTMMDLNPRQFALSLKGKELVGSTRNEVVFAPALDMHTKLVMGLQAAGGGLVSKKWQRDQIGIPDSEAMDEEMLAEVIQDAVVQGIVAELSAEPTPENADVVQGRALAYLNAEPAVPHPLLQMGAGAPPAGAAPLPALPSGGEGEAAPPGGAAGPQQFGTPAPAQDTTVDLPRALAAIQAVEGLEGRVFLVGEIVTAGRTRDEVELAVTEPADRATLAASLPFRVEFTVVAEEPVEPHVEATPGAEPAAGGDDAQLIEMMGAV